MANHILLSQNPGAFERGYANLMRSSHLQHLPLALPFGLGLYSKKAYRSLHLQHGTQRYCQAMGSCASMTEGISRRSGNYHSTIWDHNFIESIQSPYTDAKYDARIEELKLEVMQLLAACEEQSTRLELINSIKQLGVAYHFDNEIREELDQAYAKGFESLTSLHETSLCFQLLRQHGYMVSCDVFQKFRDEGKGFKGCLGQDAEGLLSLYEASYLAIPQEEVLEEAKEFSIEHLNQLKKKMDANLAEQVEHSLEMPLHWRMLRLEARYYINAYQREERRSEALLELAKLDYNVTQCMHQMEMKELSRWWTDLGLADKLKFSRDRLLENYLWAMGIAFEPQFSKCRKVLTKVICLLTVIDDIYDIYGSLEELQLFTTSIKRFNLDVMKDLPDYLKLTFLALYNFINETTYDFLKDNGWNINPFIRYEWERLCEAYFKEAQWFNKNYKPTLNEYLKNAWISVSGPLCMVHTYFLSVQPSVTEFNSFMKQSNKLLYWSSLIMRLCDDLGTSKAEMERGDTPKSIECLMNGFGYSEETSKEYIKDLVSSSWKMLNNENLKTSLPTSVTGMFLNMARTAHCIFQHGDGIGTSTGMTKDHIYSLFLNEIQIK